MTMQRQDYVFVENIPSSLARMNLYFFLNLGVKLLALVKNISFGGKQARTWQRPKVRQIQTMEQNYPSQILHSTAPRLRTSNGASSVPIQQPVGRTRSCFNWRVVCRFALHGDPLGILLKSAFHSEARSRLNICLIQVHFHSEARSAGLMSHEVLIQLVMPVSRPHLTVQLHPRSRPRVVTQPSVRCFTPRRRLGGASHDEKKNRKKVMFMNCCELTRKSNASGFCNAGPTLGAICGLRAVVSEPTASRVSETRTSETANFDICGYQR